MHEVVASRIATALERVADSLEKLVDAKGESEQITESANYESPEIPDIAPVLSASMAESKGKAAKTK